MVAPVYRCWISNHGVASGDVMRHHGTRTDHRPITDMEARQHHRTCTYKHIVAHHHLTAQSGTWRHMHSITQLTLMIDHSGVVHDTHPAQSSICGDHGHWQDMTASPKVCR
ncbi:MAG TPA: hypothetical protein PLB25_17720 [Rhodoferax sp.]|nr:hypothetical protein [Rhodoferax sp.]